jgi:ribonuclease P protein component
MRIHVEDLDVRAVVTARGASRVGFVVPKYKRSAVDRNRLKRRLRELVRTRFLPAWRDSETKTPDIDVVVRALPSAYQITMAELTRRIDRAYSTLRGRLTPEDR